ncbi:hypothetical protein H1C71_035618 [Ictidomys tridecemlineatus]|nr:hypothetical protein H1C71_035618 [Ictidomys tridecemlineatus]
MATCPPLQPPPSPLPLTSIPSITKSHQLLLPALRGPASAGGEPATGDRQGRTSSPTPHPSRLSSERTGQGFTWRRERPAPRLPLSPPRPQPWPSRGGGPGPGKGLDPGHLVREGQGQAPCLGNSPHSPLRA